MNYKVNPKKPKRMAHIIADKGNTFCQIENSNAGKNLVAVMETDRVICSNCLNLERLWLNDRLLEKVGEINAP